MAGIALTNLFGAVRDYKECRRCVIVIADLQKDWEQGAEELARIMRSRITGIAAPGISIFDLVRALHPTPAVGRFPGPAAMNWLTAHGEARSSWYSGGFGTLTANGDGEFWVALRSALISGNRIELHAGAGIVAGSDPELELAETDAKIGTLLAALGSRPAVRRSASG